MISSHRLLEIKELSEKATQYGHVPCPEAMYIFGNDKSAIVANIRDPYSKDDGLAQINHDYINAANPTTVKAMVEELLASRKVIERYSKCDGFCAADECVCSTATAKAHLSKFSGDSK